MTYQTPDGWRLPPRCPQHAAPFGSSTPLRIHTHRALRLFVTAGAWAAGLCLVVASVALVAKAAGPARATHVTSTAHHYGVPSGRLPGHAGTGGRSAPAGGAHDVLRTFAGTGNRITSQFTVAAAHSRWELRWSYQCTGNASADRLIIMEGNAARSGVSVDAAGAEGQGTTWAYSDAGTHYLVVTTNCAWTARVLGHW
jgi:hypothetical protein